MNNNGTSSRSVEPIYVKLSKMIVTRRITLGMTQVQLAAKLGISRPYLARMETGKQRIYLHHLLKLEKVLNYPLLLQFVRRSYAEV